MLPKLNLVKHEMDINIKERRISRQERERDEHLEIAGNIEGDSSGGVDDVEDREVKAKGQHTRPEYDDKGREK